VNTLSGTAAHGGGLASYFVGRNNRLTFTLGAGYFLLFLPFIIAMTTNPKVSMIISAS